MKKISQMHLDWLDLFLDNFVLEGGVYNKYLLYTIYYKGSSERNLSDGSNLSQLHLDQCNIPMKRSGWHIQSMHIPSLQAEVIFAEVS